MLTPKSSRRGQLLSQYVRARITSMNNVDLGLFDFDRHNAIYYFVVNADETIYLRYGGRDARSADTYLNLKSLELALEHGLRLHDEYLRGEQTASPRPQPQFPRDVPMLFEHTVARNRCVECHLIADYQAQQLELDGQLDRRLTMYRSPDIKQIGLELDIPRGLIVKSSKEAAALAGIQTGDRIAAIDGQTVWTFGDLQYHYSKVSRDAASVAFVLERDSVLVETRLELPARWWYSDLEYRNWSIEPLVFYGSRPLPVEEKRRLGLDMHGFASRVTTIHPAVKLLHYHALQIGDIVYAVDGVEQDDQADSCVLHIKLRKRAGEKVVLSVLRGAEQLRLPLETGRQSFRK